MGLPTVATLTAVALLLGGCANLVDTEERRLCRSLLAALYSSPGPFEITSVDEWTAADASRRVRVTFRRPGIGASTGMLTCGFARAAAGVPPQLDRIVTDQGALGPLRLRILQRYWIDSGLALQSDPAPINVWSGAPIVPRWAALALQQILAALPSIAVYALLATAYSLIYGLVGRINLAFGELATLAGYGAFLGFAMIGEAGIWPAVVMAVILGTYTALLNGGASGWLVIAPLATAPGQHILIATIGLSIVWQEAMRLLQGSGTRWMAPLMNRPLGVAVSETFVVTITPMAVVVAAVATVAAVAVVQIMRRSRFGRAWRASADDPIAAALCGVDRIATLTRTMSLAAALAGLGGILTTLYYGGVGHGGGLVVGLKALIAAIVGGIGSIPGALAGGVLIGLAETAWSAVFPIEMRDPAIFIGLAVILWLRPQGLFSQGEATREKRV